MPLKQETIWPTEADFESDLQAALRRAFPWLPPGSIHHQTKFSFVFGRARIEVDGRKQSRATGRVDILLYSGQKPLAILELKRSGHAVDDTDTAQGLSYARMLHPSPPLVAVTNGLDLVLFETHTGEKWKPTEPSEAEFERLVQNAAITAASDLKQAVSTLMGSNPAVWIQAIRQTSSFLIQELSGNWDEQLQPFVPDFLIPRKATVVVQTYLQAGKRLILLVGAPLSGKTNVLRELAAEASKATETVILLVEADSGKGILRGVADALSNALSWPISPEEARAWLLRLSKTPGPSLVIAIDGLDAGRSDIRAEIEDLTSQVFGNHLCFVIALDDNAAERLVMNSTGRKLSAIGRRAVGIGLGMLDSEEFRAAAQALWVRRIGIMNGGASSPELRLPWVLRAAASHIVADARYQNTKLAAVLPPLLALELIEHTRERFQNDELRRQFQAVAKAVLKDTEDRRRPTGLILKSMATYAVRRKTLRKFLEHSEVETLIEQGYLGPLMHESGEPILVVRIPELLASEAARILGYQLVDKLETDVKSAARWLVKAAASLPLGDIVAAQAIVDAALHQGNLPLGLISSLLKSRPEKRPITPGTGAAMHLPGAGLMKMTFQKNGSITVEAHGKRINIQEPESELPATYENFHGWLILSHLAGHAWGIETDGHLEARVEPAILTEVGTSPVVLRAATLNREIDDTELCSVALHHTPHGECVCEKVGIVEPITLSIFRFLAEMGAQAQDWLEEAVQQNSFPLLMRLNIALEALAETSGSDTFAKSALDDLIKPALSKFPLLH